MTTLRTTAGRRIGTPARIALAVLGLVVAEALAPLITLVSEGTTLLLDIPAVPGGLACGIAALAIRAKARRGAARGSGGVAAAYPNRRHRLDLAVHALLLLNLAFAATVVAVSVPTGHWNDDAAPWSPLYLVGGAVLIATIGIPVSVVATWSSASARSVAAERAALAAGGRQRGRVLLTRAVARISAALHIPLAVAAIVYICVFLLLPHPIF